MTPVRTPPILPYIHSEGKRRGGVAFNATRHGKYRQTFPSLCPRGVMVVSVLSLLELASVERLCYVLDVICLAIFIVRVRECFAQIVLHRRNVKWQSKQDAYFRRVSSMRGVEFDKLESFHFSTIFLTSSTSSHAKPHGIRTPNPKSPQVITNS
jgi:hypothetical protein